jgi:hypothetical protein
MSEGVAGVMVYGRMEPGVYLFHSVFYELDMMSMETTLTSHPDMCSVFSHFAPNATLIQQSHVIHSDPYRITISHPAHPVTASLASVPSCPGPWLPISVRMSAPALSKPKVGLMEMQLT